MTDRVGELLRLWFVAIVWLALARLLARYGVLLLPRDFARALGLHGYLGLVLVLATIVGVSLARLILSRPWRALGVTRARPSAVAAGALLAPLVLVLSAYVAFQIALPTLLAEIAAGGRQAAEHNTGAFGRALVQSHPALTVVWGVVLTPIAEELMFRGALYEAVAAITRGRDPGEEHTTRHALIAHAPAVLATTAVFAFMHADQPGGAGIVRVVQASLLGLSLALVRATSGGLVAAIILHAVFNLMTIAKLRGWIASPIWPFPLPIPLWWWQTAAICTPLLALLGLHRAPPARRVVSHGAVYVPREPAAIDVIKPDLPPPPRWLVHHDEIEIGVEPEGDGTSVRYRLSWVLTSGLLRPVARRLAKRQARALRAQLTEDAA